MANLGQRFDTSTVADSDFAPLPVGDYPVEIVASELRATKSGDGQYLWLEMVIRDGEYAGRRIWDRLNLWNANQTTVEIAQRTLKAICVAVGKPTIEDSEELHMIPFVAHARMTKSKQSGELQNAWSYKPENPDQAAPPARAAQAASAPRTTSAAPATTAPKGKPWERAKR